MAPWWLLVCSKIPIATSIAATLLLLMSTFIAAAVFIAAVSVAITAATSVSAKS